MYPVPFVLLPALTSHGAQTSVNYNNNNDDNKKRERNGGWEFLS